MDTCQKCGETHRDCRAHRRDGTPCRANAVKGTGVCHYHGGSSPQVAAKLQREKLQARIAGELRRMSIEPVTNPAAVLSEIAGEIVAFKDLAQAKLNELGRWTDITPEGVTQQKAIVGIYTTALRDAANIAAKMTSLGLTAEALRLEAERPSRELAEQFNRVLSHVLREIDLTAEQRARVPELLRDALKKEHVEIGA